VGEIPGVERFRRPVEFNPKTAKVKTRPSPLTPDPHPGAKPVYVGDTGKKWAYFDPDYLRSLGVAIEEHGKMPDVVVHFTKQNWLVLIEAVTSHGPVNPKRLTELKSLFAGSKPGLVFVTAFLNGRGLLKYLGAIAWETEVWVADTPDHMIHFNGERFLGPY
jgi:hypothetical protein